MGEGRPDSVQDKILVEHDRMDCPHLPRAMIKILKKTETNSFYIFNEFFKIPSISMQSWSRIH